MIWNDDAIGRLERVPEGFMRKAARNTVEEYAKENGFAEISLKIVEAGLAKSKEKMSAVFQERNPQEQSVNHDKKEEFVRIHAAEKEPYECGLCGLVKFGSKPDQCPSCHFDEFRMLTVEERKNISISASLILEWDQDALDKLEIIPPGFMRQMTKCRVEHWARNCGAERVTFEVVEGKYRNWEEGARTSAMELEWSAEARSRLEKIPQFIRPLVGKEIEQKAKAFSKNLVDNEVMDEVILAWSKHMVSFHFGKE
jgi:hypothetical protein